MTTSQNTIMAPIATMPFVAVINAILALQSMAASIDTARTEQYRLLVLQAVVFVVVGLAAAWALGVLWRSQERYQKAMQSGTDARIAQLDEAAASANQRVQVLENDNRDTRNQLEASKAEAEKLRQENQALTARLEEERAVRTKDAEHPAANRPVVTPVAPPVPPDTAPPEIPTKPGVRTITPSQFQVLVSDLKRFEGTQIEVWQISDIEATALADQITSLLNAANWSVKTYKFGALSPPRYGVTVVHRGNPAASALAKSLRSINMLATEEGDIGGLVVIVGLKPTA